MLPSFPSNPLFCGDKVPMTARTRLAPINLSSVSDRQNEHDKFSLPDLVNDAVISHPISAQIRSSKTFPPRITRISRIEERELSSNVLSAISASSVVNPLPLIAKSLTRPSYRSPWRLAKCFLPASLSPLPMEAVLPLPPGLRVRLSDPPHSRALPARSNPRSMRGHAPHELRRDASVLPSLRPHQHCSYEDFLASADRVNAQPAQLT